MALGEGQNINISAVNGKFVYGTSEETTGHTHQPSSFARVKRRKRA